MGGRGSSFTLRARPGGDVAKPYASSLSSSQSEKCRAEFRRPDAPTHTRIGWLDVLQFGYGGRCLLHRATTTWATTWNERRRRC
jgi:hypothetical protein